MMSKTVANPSRLVGGVARAAALGLLALAATLLQAREARAQWTQPDANNNINNTNTGNVGVGTTAPQSSLHVSTASTSTGARGIIDEQTSNDANGPLFIVRKSRAGATVQNGDSVGNFYAQAFDGTSWVNGSRLRFIIDGPVSANNVPTAIEFLTGTAGAASFERMRITSGGNVGIGISAPTARFHVLGMNGASTGSAAPTAFNVVGGSGGNGQTAGGAGGDLFLQGGAGGWNTTGSSFYYSGNGGDIGLTGGTGGQHLFGVSHAGIGGPINITGGTGGAHNVSGYAGGAGGSIVLNGGAGGTGTTPGAAGNVIFANLRGNVGVGTASPGSLLEVKRDQATGTEVRVNNANTAGFAGVYLNGGFGQSAGGFLQWNNVTGNNNLFVATAGNFPLYLETNNTPRMTVLPTSGNVGIGTSTPGKRLEVLAADGEAARLYRNVNTAGWGVNMTFALNNGNGARTAYAGVHGLIGNAATGAEAGTLLFTTATSGALSEKMRLDSAGNVGIGTTAPSKRLHVHGGSVFHQWSATAGQEYGFYTSIHNNHFTSNLYYDGQWKMLSAGKGALISTASLSGSAFNVYVDNTSRAAGTPSALTTLMQVTMDGNVGIGAASPAYKLDVQGGQLNASGGLCIAGVCKTDWSQVGGSSQWANGTSGAISYNSGNVGVGTSSPAAKLHVAGGARLEGTGRVYLSTGAVAGARGLEVVEENATTFSLRHHDPNVAWRNIAINPHGGDVGVGTASPRGKLEVAGGALFLGDMGNSQWGNVVVRGRVFSASNNIHLSPPGGTSVYIDSNYREAGGSTGPVNLNVSGDIIAGGNISAKYQDVAEWVPSTQKLSAGTVVVLDRARANHVLASTNTYDTGVAGVITEQPGVILGQGGDGKLMVATTGRVKVRVDATRAPIQIGDLIVTGEVEGVAMKSVPVDLGGTPIHRPGTIIGKALEPLAKGTGEILILLSLQ